jgi:hypothetical protein
MAESLIRGIKECVAEIDKMQAKVDLATKAALKPAQSAASARIKSGMRGRPRWDKRGRVGRDKSVPAVDLKLNPHHVSRSGGPGKLTGTMRAEVGGRKRPKRSGVGWSGGVGAGGPASYTNIYRYKLENGFPFIKPGVKKAEPKIAEVYKKAWAKATET